MTTLLGIATMYYPEGGGAELSTHLHYKALVKQGWKVSVIAYTFNYKCPTHSVIDGVSVYRIPSPVPRDLVHVYVAKTLDSLAMKLIRRLLNESEIVHIAQDVYSAIPFIKSFACKPIAVHVHDHSPICFFGSCYPYIKRSCKDLCNTGNLVSCVIGRRITKLAYQCSISRVMHLFTIPWEIPLAIDLSQKRRERLLQADIIITVSKYLARKLRYIIPECSNKVVTIYNPLPKVNYVRHYETGRCILLYTGGSDYEKGMFHLLRIWKRLVTKKIKNLELWVTGGLNSLTTRYVVKKYKLSATVKLLNRVAHEEVIRLHTLAHAAVVPSICPEGGLPYAVIEPMMVGRAVFVTPLGGVPEALRNGYGSYFIDPWKSDDSADVLARIFDLDEMARQGKCAKEHITRLLTHEKTSGRLAKILAEII